MSLRDEILAKCPAEVLASRDSAQIAESVSAGRTKLVPTEIGCGTILETIGLTSGNALLRLIKTAPDFEFVWPLLEQGRLRVDSGLVRMTLGSLVPAMLSRAQADALLALAARPDPVSEYDVRCAAWSDTGEWLL